MVSIIRKLPVLVQQFIIKHGIKLASILLILSGLLYVFLGIWIFMYIPNDYLQGPLVKIMYIHVPCAWISTLSYFGLSLCAFIFLVSRYPFYDIVGEILAKISLNTTMIALVTGSIWGKPTWGTWWVWDARLTSVFAQLFLLLLYYMIRYGGKIRNVASHNNSMQQQKYLKPKGRRISFYAAQLSAIIGIVGVVNVPIIKLSVYLWHSLHQTSSVFTNTGVKIDDALFYPLVAAFVGISFFYAMIFVRCLCKAFDTKTGSI